MKNNTPLPRLVTQTPWTHLAGCMVLAGASLFAAIGRAEDATTAAATQDAPDSAAAPESPPDPSSSVPASAPSSADASVETAPKDLPAQEALPSPQVPSASPDHAQAPLAQPSPDTPTPAPAAPPAPPPQCPTPAPAAPDPATLLPEVSPLSKKHFVARSHAVLQLTYGKGSLPEHGLRLGALGFEVGSSMLAGPRFPGFDGGHWHGAMMRLDAGLQLGVAMLTPAEIDNLQVAAMVSVGTTVGYQFLHFKRLVKARQTVYGASAGYRLGYQYTLAVSIEPDAAHGGDAYQGFALSFVRARYFPAEDAFRPLLLSLSIDRMASSDVNLFKLSIGRGF